MVPTEVLFIHSDDKNIVCEDEERSWSNGDVWLHVLEGSQHMVSGTNVLCSNQQVSKFGRENYLVLVL